MKNFGKLLLRILWINVARAALRGLLTGIKQGLEDIARERKEKEMQQRFDEANQSSAEVLGARTTTEEEDKR